jgi:predicted CXXCH cytochrome family protein
MKLPSKARLRYDPLAWALVLIVGAVLYWVVTRDRRHESFVQSKAPDVPAASVPDTNFLPSYLPQQGGPPGYVNSAACKDCHPKQYETWWSSYHRQMTQVMNTNTVKADFNNVAMDSGPARFTLHESLNHYWVDIQGIEAIKAAQLTNGPPPVPLRLPMQMMTGSHRFQVFWMPTGHGNQQIGFPFTWLVGEKHWVSRNDAFIRDPNVEQRPEQWNRVCIRCHTTGARPIRIEEKQMYDTHVAEFGIACEACHGPGETHVALEKKHRHDVVASNLPRPEIVQPAHLDHVRSSQVCGFCHSMKWYVETEDWYKNGFTYRPGDDLEQTTPIIRATKLAEEPFLTNLLAKHPDNLEGSFWSDGMVRVTGREFNGLIESKCYQKGDLSCVTCHSMHKSNPDKQIKEGMNGNEACYICHQEYRKNLAQHTHHAADSSGSLCYNCHMPYTSYGLLRGVRSHLIDRPTVLSTLKTGRPNACNLCHLDKTLQWTAQNLFQWYRQPVPELADEDQKISATVKLLLSGDAGQRALAAFSMGWEPALGASGNDWEAPLLASGLEDHYAGVRFISHRSLTHLPGFESFPYDFESTPEQRREFRQKALDLWSGSAGAEVRRAETLTGPGPVINTNEFSQLLEHRDNRPVRLHE